MMKKGIEEDRLPLECVVVVVVNLYGGLDVIIRGDVVVVVDVDVTRWLPLPLLPSWVETVAAARERIMIAMILSDLFIFY